MPRPASTHPTELELQILKILWDKSPRPVREIRAELAERGRDIAHTTVITTLNKMFDKGQLTREAENGAFLFSPQLKKEKVSRGMLGDVVERVFDGSASAVMLSLLESSDFDAQEVKELRRLLNQKIKEQNK